MKTNNKNNLCKIHKTHVYALFCVVFILCLAVATPSYGQTFQLDVGDPPHALMTMLGGLIFLLYGLEKMTSSFKALAGERLRHVLSTLTKGKIRGLFTGITVTAVVQSSSATTMMVVGFVSARLMTLPQSLTVILGADIGTTITVQLIAFRMNQYALIAIILGYFIKALSKNELFWHVGRVIMAIGLIFFGVFLIGESINVLYTVPIVQKILSYAANPFIGLLIGMVLTAALYSSAATLAIVIALAGQGVLSVEAMIALVLGANIGSSFTSYLASIGGSTDALRAASAHIFFKVCGVILVLIFLPYFLNLVNMIDPTSNSTDPRQVANMHMLFSILSALLFIPFTNHIANILTRLIPKKKKRLLVEAKFLDNFLINTPSLALGAARQEVAHMAKRVSNMMKASIQPILNGSIEEINKIRLVEREVDALYKQIIKYLSTITQETLTEDEGKELLWLMTCANRVENISDLIGVDLCEVGRKRVHQNIKISAPTQKMIAEIHAQAHEMLTQSIKSLGSTNAEESQKALILLDKRDFKKIIEKATTQQAKRLSAKEPNRFKTYALEADMLDKLQRIYHHARKIAQKTASLYADKNKG